MKLTHRFTGSLLITALSLAPLTGLAAEGKIKIVTPDKDSLFEIVEGRKGLNAVNVKIAGAAVIPLFGEQSTRRSIPENSIEFRVPVGGEGDSVEVHIITGNGKEINVIQKIKS